MKKTRVPLADSWNSRRNAVDVAALLVLRTHFLDLPVGPGPYSQDSSATTSMMGWAKRSKGATGWRGHARWKPDHHFAVTVHA